MLNISTNAIVVLIVSLVLLGAITAVIASVFRSADKSFQAQASALPKPAVPTASKPITFTHSTVHAGDSFVARIWAKPLAVEATPFLLCDHPSDDGSAENYVVHQEAFFKQTANQEYLEYLFIGTMSEDTPAQTLLCSIVTAGDDAQGTLFTQSVDVKLQVRS